MIAQAELQSEAVREMVQRIGQTHLPLQADGYVANTAMLYDVLVAAATQGISLEAATRELEQSATGNCIRALLNEQLSVETLRALEGAFNQALQAEWPRPLRTAAVEVAIDTHDEPFYGKDEELRTYACRSQARNGTSRFYRIASAYMIYRQLRVTVAVTFVVPEDDMLAIVQRLYDQLQQAQVRIRMLYLDRGFCSGTVLRYLQAQQQAAIVACAIRGKTGGTRQLCGGRGSYRTSSTFTDGTHATMVVRATLVPDRSGRRRRKWMLFAVVNCHWSSEKVYARYRRRFAIESSFRQLRQVRIRTASRNAALRFFMLAFALLLVNIWALVRWQVARVPGPGPHRLDPSHFTLQHFCALLRRLVEHIYGVRVSIPYLTPPKL